MTLCCKCGSTIGPDENFCGVCGTRQVREDSAVIPNDAVNNDQQSGASPHDTDSPAESFDAERTLDPSGGKPTLGSGELPGENEDFVPKTSRADERPDRRPKPKALVAGKVLNNRYEIVRRIGGGGMGAVYLAKDRNLGEAPRAVKEMIESHIDEAQHEKAVADFKRESLLLTALEHPSIPTVYDYFYEEISERFYLVMKFIPGNDLSSQLRNSPGGRIDELTVTEWGIQVADVLHYLHTRPQQIIYRDLK